MSMIIRSLLSGETIRAGDWFIRPATGEKIVLTDTAVRSLPWASMYDEASCLPVYREVSIASMTKNDFASLQTSLDSLIEEVAAGHDTPEGDRRMKEIHAALDRAPWKIDMDGSGDLLDRIVPKRMNNILATIVAIASVVDDRGQARLDLIQRLASWNPESGASLDDLLDEAAEMSNNGAKRCCRSGL